MLEGALLKCGRRDKFNNAVSELFFQCGRENYLLKTEMEGGRNLQKEIFGTDIRNYSERQKISKNKAVVVKIKITVESDITGL
jgi:hypothetical protein